LSAATPFEALIQQLTPLYGEGEARSIARIALEDAFDIRGAAACAAYVPRTPDEATRLQDITARLLRSEPIQYVLGVADFFSLKFLVTPAVLIPRQETEELVAWLRDDVRSAISISTLPKTTLRVLDIGLGSGCIGITLQRQLPDIQLFGCDVSADALAVATQNAQRLLPAGADVTFFEADVLDTASWADFPSDLSIIVSNPPYIPHHERDLMPSHVLDHEPALALFVEDNDPLIFYKKIAELATQKLRRGGLLRFECNEFNAQEVADWLRHTGWHNVECRQDLSGADRMVGGQLPA
jgi:release factor glutamine methyltransferase